MEWNGDFERLVRFLAFPDVNWELLNGCVQSKVMKQKLANDKYKMRSVN